MLRIVSGAVVGAAALLSSSCSTTYLSVPHGLGVMGQQATWEVSAGGDFGPQDEEVEFIHPEIIQHLISQDESNIANYYQVTLRAAFHGSGKSKLNASAHMRELSKTFDRIARVEEYEALDRINKGQAQSGDYELVARGYARAVGELAAPGLVQSIAENGYGRLRWGHLVDEDFNDLKFAMNSVYITANTKTRQVRLHSPEPHSMITTLRSVSFDFAGASDDAVLNPHDSDGNPLPLDGSMTYEEICQAVRPLSDKDWAKIKRMN
jgi:hypothetical protein